MQAQLPTRLWIEEIPVTKTGKQARESLSQSLIHSGNRLLSAKLPSSMQAVRLRFFNLVQLEDLRMCVFDSLGPKKVEHIYPEEDEHAYCRSTIMECNTVLEIFDKGVLVAYATVSSRPWSQEVVEHAASGGEMVSSMVLPVWRDNAIHQYSIDAREKWARESGVRALCVLMSEHNAKSRHNYTARGYHSGSRLVFHDPDRVRLLFFKTL
jgi:hypothetical protein